MLCQITTIDRVGVFCYLAQESKMPEGVFFFNTYIKFITQNLYIRLQSYLVQERVVPDNREVCTRSAMVQQ
jgi:hypothetical protein